MASAVRHPGPSAVFAAEQSGLDAATAIGVVVLLIYVGLLVCLRLRLGRTARASVTHAAKEEKPGERPDVAAPATHDPTVTAAEAGGPVVPYAPPDLHPELASADGPRRLAAGLLEPLGARLEMSRRVSAAESRVALALGRLPADRWMVERYVLVAGQRVPFFVIGASGVFAIWALDQTPGWDDLPFAARARDGLQALLPGYAGPVRVGLCRAFVDIEPRWWLSVPSGCDAWLLGVDWIERWLEHFGEADGLAPGDLADLARLARPRWHAHGPGTLPAPHQG